MTRIAFRPTERPRVSVLVLAWRQHDHLDACLRAIQNAAGGVAYEVILVLNGATPQIEAFARSEVTGARLVASRVNLGFSGGNNRAAEHARGEFLVLLNDDAVPEPGWLEWLVATADAYPEADAVASCILFPDGRIQEAGSIVWNDGSTFPIGRDSPGDSPEWHFVRRVDHASACSLLVRRSAWTAVGGFDERYFPAYYEDVDLCLAIAARGRRILYEPRSRVRHHESASSNADFKIFLFTRNQRLLAEKWHENLSLREPAMPWSPGAVARAVWRARGCPRRILVVDDRVPNRAMGSGFGRMFDALTELAQQGYAVSFHATSGPSMPNEELVTRGVTLVTADLDRHLARPAVFYEAVVVSRPHNFERVAGLVRRHQPWAKLLYDAEALYWRRLERQAMLASSEADAQALRRDALDARNLEERIVMESDGAVAVSREEAEILAGVAGHCPIDVLHPSAPNVGFTSRPFHERRDVAYVAGWLGGADSPNGDALRWFVAEVLPHLRDRIPWVRLRVTGANPPDEIRALADPNVVFEGHVEDLARLYDEVRVAVAPTRYGAGVKLKTVEAMQHGLPVVSTPIGAEGIDLRGLPAIDVVEDPAQFAERIAILLTDPEAWEVRRKALAKLVRSWGTPEVGGTWTQVLERTLSRGGSGE